MEIRKTFKATPLEMDMLFESWGDISLRYFEIDEIFTGDDNKKYKYKAVFRISDELKNEIQKAKSFKKIFELYKKYNAEGLKEYINKKIKMYENEIKKLNKIRKELAND